MPIDTFFAIGKSHKVCEDYAFGNDSFFGISDGCSSSKNTDFGSRILLRSLIKNDYHVGLTWGDAKSIVDKLLMQYECLDATLNYGIVTKKDTIEGIETVTIGDGFIVAQRNNGNFEVIEIEFDKNAPYYLAYEYDEGRRSNFLSLNQKKSVTIKVYNSEGNLQDNFLSTKEDNVKVDRFTTFWFPFDTYKSVSVFSDGLKTFIPHDQTQPKLPLEKIVKEIISFPLFNGEFVKRKCIKFIKNHPESSFYDDFSMATFVRN
jgi:hypothetical protein